jgi:hypothetical protein
MKELPETENPLLIRTDFSDEAAWEDICEIIQTPVEEGPVEGLVANLEFLDEPELDGLSKAKILALAGEDYVHSFIILADKTSFAKPEHPLLVVDLLEERGREFRAIPSIIWAIENNLTIGNLGFEDFTEALDRDGVFRKLPEI